MGLNYKNRLLAFSANFRLGCKCLTVTNPLAYNKTELITAIKYSIVEALGERWVTKSEDFKLL
jgi:hypothetical protein